MTKMDNNVEILYTSFLKYHVLLHEKTISYESGREVSIQSTYIGIHKSGATKMELITEQGMDGYIYVVTASMSPVMEPVFDLCGNTVGYTKGQCI